MSLTELFILAVGVSMDAFAVAVCKGLSIRHLSWRHAVLVGLYFGGFQAAMPVRIPLQGRHRFFRSLDCLPSSGSHRLQYDPGGLFQGRG